MIKYGIHLLDIFTAVLWNIFPEKIKSTDNNNNFQKSSDFFTHCSVTSRKIIITFITMYYFHFNFFDIYDLLILGYGMMTYGNLMLCCVLLCIIVNSCKSL